jgi:transcriptional regulator with XRE-family HTH domain
MKDQLLKFITLENISATKLADDIGVQRSSISHILSGRNKPSYDFIEKMILRYPSLNAEWLITGRGNTYKTAPSGSSVNHVKEPDLFSSLHIQKNIGLPDKSSEEPAKKTDQEKKGEFTNVNRVEKIVFFYTNGEFREYIPSDSHI